MFAAHHGLNNLTIIIDNNNLQSLESVDSTLSLKPLDDKLRAFGWNVYIVNGHNHNELKDALSCAKKSSSPAAVIMLTTKGKGVSFMEILWRGITDRQMMMRTTVLLVRLFCHEECSDQLVDA